MDEDRLAQRRGRREQVVVAAIVEGSVASAAVDHGSDAPEAGGTL